MDDNLVAAIWHGIAGGAAAVVALISAASSRHSSASRDGLLSAERVELGGGRAAAALQPGAWVAVSGTVAAAAAAAPLVSLNKDRAVLVEQVVTTRRHRLDGHGELQRRVKSREWQDVPWQLEGGGDAVEVERDAVRRAHERSAGAAVRDLVPGGTAQLPRTEAWFVTLWKALAGVVDEEDLLAHSILPVGMTATVVGTLHVRSDGRPCLGLHPRLGLWLFRRDVDTLAHELGASARWTGVLAALAAGAAGWQLWEAALRLWPTLPPLRQRVARALCAVTGVRLERWLALENPCAPPRQRTARSGGARLPSSSGGVHPDDAPAAAHGGDACVVCRERRHAALLRGCGHLCLCLTCAELVGGTASPRCPVCRRTFSARGDVVRVFAV